uniref:Kelch-like protein 7-like n=1 Tax=Saccoglossus kowalevskii TaxID=10224 RepID=A0ABM0MCD8_SACKO|nr:PREDICTED: kelch-like protein 7-like [Saccoglossus kowalevskii]
MQNTEHHCYAENDNETLKDTEKLIDDHSDLGEKMLNLFNNRELSDVVLQVGEFKFPAHRMILVNSSEYFERMFTQNWKEKDQKVVTLEVVEECHELFEGFLKYIYTNQLKISVYTVLHYYILADKYMVTPLKNSCLEFMIDNFNVNPDIKRVMAWMKCADRPGDLESKLKEKLIQFIALNLIMFEANHEFYRFDITFLKELLKRDDLTVPDEFTLHHWVIQWLKLTKSNKRSPVKILCELLPLIRFKTMPLEHLDELLNDDFVKEHSDHYVLEYIVPAFRYHAKSALPSSSKEHISEALRCYVYGSSRSSSKTKTKQRFCLPFARKNFQSNPTHAVHPISVKSMPLSATSSNADLGDKT